MILRSRGIDICYGVPYTSIDFVEGFRFMNCFIQIFENKANDACTRLCQPACTERVYKSSVSVSGPWPHRAYLDQFYKSHVKGTVVEYDLNSLNVIFFHTIVNSGENYYGIICL